MRRIRLETMLIVSLLASVPVSFVGTIGFVGLAGALLLSVTSIVSKSIVPGVVFPIGIITALVGVPFFLSPILTTVRNSW